MIYLCIDYILMIHCILYIYALYTFIHLYTNIHVYIRIYIYIYIHIHTYIYIYIHTRTHVHSLPTAWYYIFCCTSLSRCLHADRPETIVADDRFSKKIALKQNSKIGARSVEIRFHHYPFCSLIILDHATV